MCYVNRGTTTKTKETGEEPPHEERKREMWNHLKKERTKVDLFVLWGVGGFLSVQWRLYPSSSLSLSRGAGDFLVLPPQRKRKRDRAPPRKNKEEQEKGPPQTTEGGTKKERRGGTTIKGETER